MPFELHGITGHRGDRGDRCGGGGGRGQQQPPVAEGGPHDGGVVDGQRLVGHLGEDVDAGAVGCVAGDFPADDPWCLSGGDTGGGGHLNAVGDEPITSGARGDVGAHHLGPLVVEGHRNPDRGIDRGERRPGRGAVEAVRRDVVGDVWALLCCRDLHPVERGPRQRHRGGVQWHLRRRRGRRGGLVIGTARDADRDNDCGGEGDQVANRTAAAMSPAAAVTYTPSMILVNHSPEVIPAIG